MSPTLIGDYLIYYMLVWALPLASQDQTRHENAKSMNCAMLGIRLSMPLFKYNSNIDIG